MAQQIINVGAAANDGTGDTLRGAFIKTDENFDELYTNRISGSGTDNYVPRFNGTNALENSIIFDNGTNVGIGTTSPSEKLDVNGMAKFGSILTNASNGSGGQEAIRINNDNGYIGFFNTANSVRSGYLQGNTTDVTLTTSNSTPLIFGTANTEKMRITSDGNVGIGTTSPTFLGSDSGLQISKTSVAATLRLTNSTSNFDIANDGAGVYQMIRSNNDLYFGTNNIVRQTITAAGNVGIGTTTPSGLWSGDNRNLNILSPANHSSELVLSRTAGSVSAASISNFLSGTTADFGIYTTAALNYSIHTSGSERMRIASNGNVGIGTTTPFQSKVHILKSESGSSPIPVLRIGNQGAGYTSRITLTDETTNDANISYIGSIQSLGFGVGASLSQMIINSAGNVGIGTTSPASKLQVEGQIRVNNSIVGLTLNRPSTSTYNGLGFLTNGVGQWFFGMRENLGSNNLIAYSEITSSDVFTLNVSNNNALFSGNVGIGTTSPGSKLSIVGLPTSSAGLSSGDIWNDGGTLKIV